MKLIIKTTSGKSAGFISLFLILLHVGFVCKNNGEKVWEFETEKVCATTALRIAGYLKDLMSCEVLRK